MTSEEFKEKMEEIHTKYGENTEMCHKIMDDALCDELVRLGFAEGVMIFKDEKKWYI